MVTLIYMKSRSNQIRRKRSDTKIGTIEKRYGVDFGTRSDMKLGTYLEKKGFSSLSKALERSKPKKK